MDPSQRPDQTPGKVPAETLDQDGSLPPVSSHVPPIPPKDPKRLTGPERRRRIVLLTFLLLLLAVLAYVAYYYTQNKRLPTLGIAPPGQNLVTPPQFLYAFSGEGANQVKRPVGVAIGPDRRVYVVDFGNKRVSIFTNAGRYLSSFNTVADGKKLSNPVHLVIKGNEVWVTDRRLRSISVFDLEGKFLRTFEPRNEKLNWTPLALGFDNKGQLRVTDVGSTTEHRVIFFSEDGSRTAMFGKTAQATNLADSPGDFLFPNGVAVDKANNVYISDGDNRRVQVFSPEGAFKSFIDASGVPRGIAIDAKDRLYVVDALANAVEVYALDGKSIAQFGSRGFGPGQFNYPNDVALDTQGRIYVTDRENNQVQVWGWPVAALPAIPMPRNPWYWLACLAPLLLLPLLLLRRKVRIIVTPDFVDGLIEANEIAAVAGKSRLRLIAPLEDEQLYAGRVVEDVVLAELIKFEEHSDSDVRSLIDKLQVNERQAILISMTWRAKALGTQDREMRWLAVLAEVRAINVPEFQSMFLNRDVSQSNTTK
jgi:DNA-binding beta-propeller fold protein YncE